MAELRAIWRAVEDEAYEPEDPELATVVTEFRKRAEIEAIARQEEMERLAPARPIADALMKRLMLPASKSPLSRSNKARTKRGKS